MDPNFQLKNMLAWTAAALAIAACDGSAGKDGERGPQGTPGKDGNTGPSGSTGQSGSDGSDGIDGEDGEPGRNGSDATVDPTLSPVEKVFAGIGGRDKIAGLRGYRLTVEFQRAVSGEAYAWDAPAIDAHTGTGTISVDLTMQNIRQDISRVVDIFGFPVPQTYSIRVNAGVGAVDGVESLFGTPTGDLLSDAVAAIQKETMLLNPHALLQSIDTHPDLVSDGGLALLDGSIHHLLNVADPVHPITLWVNAQTGRISKAATVESEPLLRDRQLQAFYFGWEAVEDGPSFPRVVMLALDDLVLVQETRVTVEANPVFPALAFQLPPGAHPVFDEAAFDRGLRTSTFHQSFAAIGIRVDGLQTFVMPTEVAPGVWFLTGGSHNSLAIEQAQGIVIVEPPLYEERSAAIIAWAAAQFPTKPITQVAVTHWHSDHSGGVRAFVAAGAELIVGEPSLALYKKVIDAPSTIIPDALSARPARAVIHTVSAGDALTVSDAIRPVSFLRIPNSHAGDMIVAYVPSAQLVFVSDLFNPGFPAFPVPWPTELYDGLVDAGFDGSAVGTVAGGHGATAAFDDLRIAAGR